ncbi:TPA: cytochrome B5, partial [Enterococcus faecium]
MGDGQDGSQAYVAVGDVVYDVTDAEGWEDGVHEGGIEAGNVYAEEDFEESPHGTEVLDNV